MNVTGTGCAFTYQPARRKWDELERVMYGERPRELRSDTQVVREILSSVKNVPAGTRRLIPSNLQQPLAHPGPQPYVPVRWGPSPVGTFAVEAYRHWQLHTGESKRRSMALLAGLVNKTLTHKDEQTVQTAVRAAVVWVPRVPRGKTLTFTWAVRLAWRPLEGRFAGLLKAPLYPLELAWLSAVHGLRSGRLRPCRLCKEPFRAADKWEQSCKGCQDALVRARQPEIRRVLDRLRKRPGGRSLRQDALADLRVLSDPEWETKWDRKDPLGRGAPRRH